MKELFAWLQRGSKFGCRRATLGDYAVDGKVVGFEIGLFCRESFKPDGTPLQGEGWRYFREPDLERAQRVVEVWTKGHP